VRPSKAVSAFRTSAALRQAGFQAADVAAAGEYRQFGVLCGAFLVTEAVEAPNGLEFAAALSAAASPATKRHFLAVLGTHVARMHEAGFCHGDLVPTNVRVQGDANVPRLILLDHDRTQAWGRGVPLRRARRNLVQLNRFVVTGLTAADRWRVFRAYCATRGLTRRASRRLARWVIGKTVERRRQFDGIEEAERMSFRALMQVASRRPPQG
jgi:hypothetical protein